MECKKGVRSGFLFLHSIENMVMMFTLVAQFDKMIDKQIRSLIEYEYVHRKVKELGAWGQIINAAAGGGLIFAVKRWYPIGEKIGTETIRINRRYFDLYDTLNTFGD